MSAHRTPSRRSAAAALLAAALTAGVSAAPVSATSPGRCDQLIAYREGGPIGTSSRISGVPASGTGDVQTIYDGRLSELDPEWSPDGRQLVFATRLNTNGTLTDIGLDILDVTTGGVRVLLREGPSLVRYPAWSPRGDAIAYTSSRDLPGEGSQGQFRTVRIVGVDGGENRSVTVLPPGEAVQDLVWHPDGDRIFITSRNAPHFHWRLWSVQAEGGDARLLDDSGSLGYPRFFDDATTPWMLVEGDEQGFSSVYATHERLLKPLNRIFDAAEGQWSPAIGPDGSEVAYLTFHPFVPDSHQLRIISLADGAVRELVGPVEGAPAFAREGLSWQPKGVCVAGFRY